MINLNAKRRNQIGASILEYAIALALLGIAFFWAGRYLQRGAEERGNMTMDAGRDLVPCHESLPIAGMGSDACK